jgi:hypothetical protein
VKGLAPRSCHSAALCCARPTSTLPPPHLHLPPPPPHLPLPPAGKLEARDLQIRSLQARREDLEASEQRLTKSCTEMKLQLANQMQELAIKAEDVRALQVGRAGARGYARLGAVATAANGLWLLMLVLMLQPASSRPCTLAPCAPEPPPASPHRRRPAPRPLALQRLTLHALPPPLSPHPPQAQVGKLEGARAAADKAAAKAAKEAEGQLKSLQLEWSRERARLQETVERQQQEVAATRESNRNLAGQVKAVERAMADLRGKVGRSTGGWYQRLTAAAAPWALAAARLGVVGWLLGGSGRWSLRSS